MNAVRQENPDDQVYEKARSALQRIPVGGHDERFRIACALKSEFGEAGRVLWDTWRGERGSDKADSDWRSIDPIGEIGIGTLFHLAKENGWRERRTDSNHFAPSPKRSITAEVFDRTEVFDGSGSEPRRTAEIAAKVAKAASSAQPSHPYLQRKGIPALSNLYEIDINDLAGITGYVPQSKGVELKGRVLAIPVNKEGQLSTLELIDEFGRKSALRGRGTKSGGFWATQELPADGETTDTLLVGEGVATVITATIATAHIGIATLSSGNLCKVCEQLRGRYKNADIVVLADLGKDSEEPDHHALEAARRVSGRIAIPDFGGSRDRSQNDFNDLSAVVGLEAIRQIIDGAAIPTATHDDGQSLLVRLPGDFSPKLDDHALVQGLLPEKALAAMIGASNTGKSALALDLCVAVAMGFPFRGLRVRQCAVLYVATEGAQGLHNRMSALRVARELAPDAALGVVTVSVDLCSSPADSSLLVAACTTLELMTGHPVGLVVIDTVARAMNGADENSGADMGRFLANAEDIKTQTGATVLLIHHAGKDTSKGARGHSSFRAALDTEITVEGATNPRTVAVTKQRDLAPLEPFAFNLVPVALGTNTYGESVSAVVVEHSEMPTAHRLKASGKNQSRALSAITEWARATDDPIITNDAFTDLLKRQFITNRQRRAEVVNFLVNGGILTKSIGGYTVDRSVL